MPDAQTPIDVFCSYSRADEPSLQNLEMHLAMFQRQRYILSWHVRKISPGTDWAQAIDTHLEQSAIILLLVSPDFLASDYCYAIEMQHALQRHDANEARVIPLILRPCAWMHTPFAKLQCLPRNGKAITLWDNQDLAWTDVASGIRKAIEDLSLLSATARRTPLPTVWNIPYPRNPLFTGRERILTQIADSLKMGQPTMLSQPLAISGLGGVGKTQIAIEYAYRQRQDYQTILWTLAGNRESLVAGYITIAELLMLPERGAPEQMIVVRGVIRWLTTHNEWLLLLDNADDLAIVREFIPSAFNGHILLTTRTQSVGRLARRIEVDTMPQEVGVLFLLRRALLISPDAPLEDAATSDIAMATEIWKELGGLPLALDQAGAYIEETQCSLSDYRSLYHTRRVQMLNERGGHIDDHPEPVATTWLLSLEEIEHRSPASADLLRFCAFLHPDAIPEELLSAGAKHIGPLLQPIVSDPFSLNKVIAALSAYSLINRDTREKTLSIHRLVQAVIKDVMDEQTQREWARRAVFAVNEAFPMVEFTTWPQCKRYLPHALACAESIEQGDLLLPEAAPLLNRVGMYLYERGRWSEAEPLLKRASVMRERDPEHPDTANSLNNLAILYYAQGKYEQAEPLLIRTLAINEQQLGAQHPSTATSLSNLAGLYDSQGKYEEAKPLYERAIAINEQQLGPEHPNTATSLNNLASLYVNQGKYEQAEPLYERVLMIYAQQLGLEHPNTATSLSNLAELYHAQGRYEQSELLYQRVLALKEGALGPDHPSTATSLNNLAGLYDSQGKYEQAEPLYERALAIKEKALGTEHPSVATSLSNLASLYINQGKYEEAEPLLKRALAINEQQLGPQHPITATSLNNLAEIYRAQGKYERAEWLLRRSLHNLEQVLGSEHPDISAVLNNLAFVLQEKQHYSEAEALYRHALQIDQSVYGRQHTVVATDFNNLGALLYQMERYVEAEYFFLRALDIDRSMLGDNHPTTGTRLKNLSLALLALDRQDEARQLLLEAEHISGKQPHDSPRLIQERQES